MELDANIQRQQDGPERPARAAGYIRVSTERQAEEGYSLDAQERMIRERCEREGWTLVQIYADRGV